MSRILRKIIHIDEDKCNGCGECVAACAEGAIAIRDGKAKLVSDTYCDGLGACLGECPQGAISIAEREAEAFDEAAVAEHLKPASPPAAVAHFTCPGAAARSLNLNLLGGSPPPRPRPPAREGEKGEPRESALTHWPIKLRLVPPTAAFFQDADLLLVADCVPFAYADFHERLLDGRPVVIACPKLDERQPEVEKLTAILAMSSVRSLTVIHMEVPCCTGLVRMAEAAVAASGKEIPIGDVTISLRGQATPPAKA